MKKITLLLLSSFVALSIVEFVLREYEKRNYHFAKPTFKITSKLTVKRPQSKTYQWKQPDFDTPHRVTYNQFGLRGEKITRDPPQGKKRILLLGDSFTEDPYVADEHHIAAILQRLLDLGSPGSYEVCNAGMIGSGPVEQYLFLKQLFDDISIDLVIQLYCPNDIDDLDRQSYMVGVDDKGDPQWQAPRMTWDQFFHQFRFINLLKKKLLPQEQAVKRNLWEFNTIEANLYDQMLQKQSTDVLEKYASLMKQTVKLVKKNKAQLIELLIPMPHMFEWDRFSNDKHFERITKIHQSFGVKTYNLRTFFDQHFIRNNKFPLIRHNMFFLRDIHLNESGNLAAAIFIQEKILNEKPSYKRQQQTKKYIDSFNPLLKKYQDFPVLLHSIDQIRYQFRVVSPKELWFIDELEDVNMISYDWDSHRDEVTQVQCRWSETLTYQSVRKMYLDLFSQHKWIIQGGPLNSKKQQDDTLSFYFLENEFKRQCRIKFNPSERLIYLFLGLDY